MQIRTYRYWRLGRCTRGDACAFRHVGQPAPRLLPCRFWRLGRCFRGAAACAFSHDPNTREPCPALLEAGKEWRRRVVGRGGGCG